jgi:sarcosine oxidase subunit beta
VVNPTADVVIVGAGVTGCSIAWHLARLGVRDVLLLEQLPAAGQGSTSKANGGIRAQFSTPIHIEMSRYSIAAYRRFADETGGGDCGLLQAGYLFLTATEPGERALRANFTLQQRMGVPNRWVSPAEIAAIAPYVRADDLRGGTFSPEDGFIDPHGSTLGYLDAARRLGVTFSGDTEVLEVTRDARGVTGVRTSRGDVATRSVVNAAGPHAGVLADRAGVTVPIAPVRRMLACTEALDGAPPVIPMTIDLDTGLLIRREGRGILFAYSDPADPPGFDTSFDPAFVAVVAEKAAARFPFCAEAEVSPRRCWAGLYPETPDHHAILGAHPELEGFHLAIGFGGHGIMHAPATGIAVAEQLVHGESRTLDVRALRPRRFAEGDTIVETAVL